MKGSDIYPENKVKTNYGSNFNSNCSPDFGGAGAYAYQKFVVKSPKSKKETAKEESTEAKDSREIILDAKNEALKIKREAEEEASKVRSEVLQLEARLAAKEENLDKKLSELEKKRQDLLIKKQIWKKLELSWQQSLKKLPLSPATKQKN